MEEKLKREMEEKMKRERKEFMENTGIDLETLNGSSLKMLENVLSTTLRKGLENELKRNPDDVGSRKTLLGLDLMECSGLIELITWKIVEIPNEEFLKFEENLTFVIKTLQETAKVLEKEV